MKKNITIFIEGRKYQLRVYSLVLLLLSQLRVVIPIMFVLSVISISALNLLNVYVSKKSSELAKIEQSIKKLDSRSEEMFHSIDKKREITKISSEILNVNTFGLGEYGIGGGALSDEITRTEHLNIKLGVYSNLVDNIIHSKEQNNNKKISILNDLSSRPSIKPAEGRLASRFGYRIHPITHTKKFHNGLDICGSTGTDVVSTSDGVVIESRYSKSFGNVIKIKHLSGEDEYFTVYAHLNRTIASVGNKVRKGDLIGAMGNTGRSTGTHLHYEVHKNGVLVNPIQYFYPEDNIVD